MKEVRLQDVARLAGVSPASVTRAIRGSGYVSKENREKIYSAMKELGYTPPKKEPAKGPGVRPYVIVFSPVASGGNILFYQIAEALSLQLQSIGWMTVPFYLRQETAEDIPAVIERMSGPGLKGIVFNCIGSGFDWMKIRKFLVSFPACIVMLERSPEIYGLNKVMLNAREMLFTAVRHLSRLGHKHILFVGVDKTTEVERSRKEGFLAGIEAMGIRETSSFLSIPDYTCWNGFTCMEEYLETNPMPTAIIAADPVMIGISNALYRRGLRVPDQVSLLGLDDTLARYGTPRLSSISFPTVEIAQNAMRILVENQAGDALPQNVLLSMRLVDRGSTGKPRET